MCINCRLNEAFGRYAVAAAAVPRSRSFTRRHVLGSGLVCTAAAATPSFGAFATEADDAAADIVFESGKVYTQEPSLPWAEALAVRGRTIAAVGSNADMARLKGPHTKVVVLNGRLLMPGFVEGHIHPCLGSFLTSGVDLQLPDLKAVQAAIRDYAEAHPVGPICGFGWRVDMFPAEGPTRQILDAIVPDRPAFFFAIDAHSVWANSKALDMAGIGKDTPDPLPGLSYFVRDADGYPTGYALEVNAVLQLVAGVQPFSRASLGTLLREWLPKASAAGITSIFDAGVPPIGSDQAAILSLYTELEAEQALPFRVVASCLVKSPPIEDAVARLQDLRSKIASDLVGVQVVKIIGDGTQEGYTAWLVEPYADRPDFRGASPFSPEEWKRLVRSVDAAGFDVHVHACGDATAREALNAIEHATAVNAARDRRHTIAHLVYINDEDIPRFGKLGVVSQFSANWFSADDDTLDILKQRYGDRQKLIYRPRSALESGGRISFGTDWPAAGYFSTYKPLDSIQVAVTRQLVGRPDAPVLEPAAQRLSVADAVHANTLGAAYQIRLDDKVGSLKVGKRADLIVLQRNIFEGAVHDIASTKIDMTMMDGKVVHGEL